MTSIHLLGFRLVHRIDDDASSLLPNGCDPALGTSTSIAGMLVFSSEVSSLPSSLLPNFGDRLSFTAARIVSSKFVAFFRTRGGTGLKTDKRAAMSAGGLSAR